MRQARVWQAKCNSSRPQVKTAFILDPDIGFGFWLARGLDQSDYQSFPARSVADASALLDELRIGVDLLILNAALPDTAELIESLRRLNEELKVVALIGDQPRLPGIAARVDLCCRKPDRTDAKRLEWIAHVEELLPVSLLGAAFKNSAFLRECAGALVRHTQRRVGGLVGSQRPSSAAVPSWKDWEGRILHDQFRLERYLGGSESSAVFLTRYGDGAQQAAAIKVVLADSVDRELLLPRWERAASLSHPGLVRLFDMGSCDSGGASLLYLVMEYAEEKLADVLEQRPLTPAETREVIELILNALEYIHSRDLVHGCVRPSNILGVADQLKISSDGLRAAGEPSAAPRNRSVYDPPESATGIVSPAGDVWSLGITLVEALTQRPPLRKRPQRRPPVLPASLPPLFLDLAHQCLQPDPSRRQTATRLAERLRQSLPPETVLTVAPRPSLRLWRYAIPAAVIVLALSGVLLRRPHQVPAPVAPFASTLDPTTPPLSAQPQAPPAPAPPPLLRPATLEPPRALPPSRQITQQVLPEVSQRARDTIQGTLEVRVRARVGSSGSVIEATLESPGPSRYFANRALDAARRWKFSPLAVGVSQSPPEEWILRFDYAKAGTEVSGERATP
jgi:TonB family protein